MKVIYRHLKPNGETFYIGIGSENRANSMIGRNKFWKNIYNLYGCEVEILAINLTWKEACEMEKVLISWFGRRDLGLGTLVNLTDGGDGTTNRIFSEEHKRKLTLSQIGSLNHRFGKKGVNKGKLGKFHPASKKVLCKQTQQIWDCVKDCAIDLKISYDMLIKQLNGQRKNKTTLIYLKNYENNKN